MVGVGEVLDAAVLGVTNVMVWVTLRRRIRETRTGGGRHLCHLCRFTPVFILIGYTRSVPDKDL